MYAADRLLVSVSSRPPHSGGGGAGRLRSGSGTESVAVEATESLWTWTHERGGGKVVTREDDGLINNKCHEFLLGWTC